MTSQQSSAKFRQKLVLTGLGIWSCLIGMLLQLFIPDVYSPFYLYLGVAVIAWGIVLTSSISNRINHYIHDYATFVYLFMYLAAVYLAFLTHFEPHHTLILLAAHVLFSMSFQSFIEYVLFALSSLILLIISVFSAPPLYFDRFMFISTFTLFTFAAGIVTWIREEKRQQEYEYKDLLSIFLNRHSDAVFILSDNCNHISYKNQAAHKFLSYIFNRTEITGQALLDLLGLNRDFLIKRFETAEYHVQERCLCQLNVNRQQPLKFEIYINKVQTAKGDGLLLTLRDANLSTYRSTTWSSMSGAENGSSKEHIPLHVEKVEITSLIPLIVENIENHIDSTKMEIQTHIQPVEDFHTDVQILSSAIKHILLSIIHRQKIEQKKPHIFIAVNQDRNFVKFIIQDNGGHIDGHLLKVASKKIEALHAQLNVLEEPDSGNIFTFSLPIQLPKQLAKETPAN